MAVPARQKGEEAADMVDRSPAVATASPDDALMVHAAGQEVSPSPSPGILARRRLGMGDAEGRDGDRDGRATR